MLHRFRSALIRTAAAALAFTVASAPAATPQKPVLTDALAHTALAAALVHARAAHAPGAAIAIVDDGGSVVLVERLDGTFPAGPDISVGKARTAAAFRKPTRVFEELINKGRTAMVTVPAVTHFTPLQGGVPLVVDGEVVGGIGVSGAASAAQDDEIAQAGADGFAAATPATDARLFPAPRVAEALRNGATLEATGEYSVNMSRRDGPGSAEVHVRDTDIIYVLSGSAELVTGGAVVGGTASGPDEIRGRAIAGGTAQTIVAGDVVTIPRGVPHWFRVVPAPFTYFVVKSTATGG